MTARQCALAKDKLYSVVYSTPTWCITVNKELPAMINIITNERSKKTVRASISFPAEDYEKLERLASEKKVSLAWMVREAVSVFLQNNPTSKDRT